MPARKELTATMATKIGIGLGVIFLAVILLSVSIVSVPEDQYVVIKRFDKIIDVPPHSGLFFKVPFVDTIITLPNNTLLYDLSPSDVLTLDKKAMTVSSYVLWQITNPTKFLQTVYTKKEAETRLDAAVYNAMKNTLSSINQAEAISTRGAELDTLIAGDVRRQMADQYGINVIDIQIKQFDLPIDNKGSVYTRMISEREQIAAQFRAEGQELAEKEKNTADKEAALILSQAKATAEKLKAEGESGYMKILSEAYSGSDRAEFYSFIRTLDALKITLKGDKTIILPIDSPLTKMLIAE